MKPSEAIRIATIAANANEPYLLVGPPGIGKSAINKEVARLTNRTHIMGHPSVEDVSVPCGLPMDAGDHAEFKPYGVLHKVFNSKKKTLWDLEDLGQAPKSTQAAYMPYLHARELNGRKIPKCVTICASTNRKEDNAGVAGLIEPVKSRFGLIIDIEPDESDFRKWYNSTGLPKVISGFLASRPAALFDWKPSKDIKNQATPRTWEKAARLLQEYEVQIKSGAIVEEDVGYPILTSLLAGAVGMTYAGLFGGFYALGNQIGNVEEIFSDPESFSLPNDPTHMAFLCSRIVQLACDDGEEKAQMIPKIFDKIGKASTDAAMLMFRDMIASSDSFLTSPYYEECFATDLGEEMIEALQTA